MTFRFPLIVLAVLATTGVAHAKSGASQPYAGQQGRAVTSLSTEDIAQIEAGQGWGLAKPAELNGYPGPAHVIELAEQLKLSETQRRQVEDIFQTMRRNAIEAGRQFIEAERKVDQVFRSKAATRDALSEAGMAAAIRRAALRLVHLDAHIETARLLSAEQRRHYDQLRGYGAAGAHGGQHGHGAHNKQGH